MRRAALALLLALTLAACARPQAGPAAPSRRIRIGFSMDTLQEERWQRDRDLFVAHARELGAEVIVQAAAGDDYLQRAQAENMLRRGVDVLVAVPHSATAMTPVVAEAHAAGVKVIAYDRLITHAGLDLYISFDNVAVGELQARYLLARVPTGRYVYIGGSPNDNNAYLLRQGSMQVLGPHVQSGEVQLVYMGMTKEWRPENAKQLMREALAQAGGRVDAVIAANDGTAGGVIQALAAAGLAGKVAVSGQDADLAAVRRIVAGTQTMTVYKPIHALASRAAEAAVLLARGGQPPVSDHISSGGREVPAYLIQPVAVTRDNIEETVIRDGFHSREEIYGNQQLARPPAAPAP